MTVNRWQAADERRNELVVEFRRGKVIEMGPSVDDYDPERLRQIMGQVVVDSAKVLERLALGPGVEDAKLLERAKAAYAASKPEDYVTYSDEDLEALRQSNDFFEEDEPIEAVKATWDAAEKQLTEPPADGTGWCAPSP